MTDFINTIFHIWKVFVETNTFNFVLFAAVFVWIFKKINIKGTIDSLHKKIVTTIETAKAKKEEAKARLKTVEKEVINLPEELTTMALDAKKSAESIEKKVLEDAEKQAENIKATSHKIIEAEAKMLTSKLTHKASKASVEVAKGHIKKTLELNPSLHEKYISESIEAIDRINF